MVIQFGVIEFGFALNGLLSTEYTTRDAALAAAESGNESGSDCSILRVVESRTAAPSNHDDIIQVRIYKAQANGNPVSPPQANVFVRTTDANVQYVCPDGTGKVPYRRTQNSYDERTRCNQLNGCNIAGQKTVDTIGVEMTQHYSWKTPLANLLPMTGGGYDFTTGNAMRMEPIL
jgi:hypothetical protein